MKDDDEFSSDDQYAAAILAEYHQDAGNGSDTQGGTIWIRRCSIRR